MMQQTWWEDDGELTELDTSDEEDEAPMPPPPRAPSPEEVAAPRSNATRATRATTQQATSKSRARGGLKNAVPCLKPPRTTNYSASSLYEWIRDGFIELNPEYQRGVVWTEIKQSALIGSIFQNYYVPPIVFTVIRQDDGREIRVCIDGKQRLTSIKRFMQGEIAHKDPTSNRKAYFFSPPGAKRKLISDIMQSNFKNKQITCVEYEDLTGEQEREIFQRVQLGVTLAPADRLPAINGPYADLVRDLRYRIETTQGFELYLNWGKARGKDFQALAQIVYLISFGQKPNKAEPTPTRLEAFLTNQEFDNSLKVLHETAMNVMDIFCRISYDDNLGRPIRKNLSPLEFVMASYLVYTYRKRYSDTQLSFAMDRMRKSFAKACPDKKSNTKNFKHIFSFVMKEVPKEIDKSMPSYASEKTAFDTPIDRKEVITVPRQAITLDQGSERETKPSTSGKAVRKRKREEGYESDSSDYVIAKKRTKPKVEKQTPAPAEAGSSSTTKKETAPASKLKVRAGPSRAQTTVKRSVSANIQAIDRKNSLDGQVGTPTVRPPTSSRNGLLASIASTSQVSVSAPSSSRQAPASTSSAKAVKKPTPTPYAFSGPTERAPLPGRTRATATPGPAPEGNPTPLPNAASSSNSASATTYGQPQVQGQAQAQRRAPQEVRNTIPVLASRSSVTDTFPAACASATPTSANTGGRRRGYSGTSERGKAMKAPVASANSAESVLSAVARVQAEAGGVREQGQRQASHSNASGAKAGTSANTAASAKACDAGVSSGGRKRLPKFNKTVRTGVDQAAAGQVEVSSQYPQQALRQVECNANPNTASAKVRSASTGSMWSTTLATHTSMPSISPTTPEEMNWTFQWPSAAQRVNQAAPTRDPRIVAREAAAAEAACQESRNKRRLDQMQRDGPAPATKTQQQQQQYAQSQAPTHPTRAPPILSCPTPSAGHVRQQRVFSDPESPAHPSKRPRASQYPSGL